jgi:hypothetical protein
LSIDEFRGICNEVFSYETTKDGKKKRRKGFPVGCSECPDRNNDDCFDNCLWPETYWKYEEVKRMWLLAKAANGGMDLNRIKSLGVDDFIKLSIVKEYL